MDWGRVNGIERTDILAENASARQEVAQKKLEDRASWPCGEQG